MMRNNCYHIRYMTVSATAVFKLPGTIAGYLPIAHSQSIQGWENIDMIQEKDEIKKVSLAHSVAIDINSIEQHREQIAVLAMRTTRKVRPSDSWRKHVGKYAEDSEFNRILDRGRVIREAERNE